MIPPSFGGGRGTDGKGVGGKLEGVSEGRDGKGMRGKGMGEG